MRIMALDVGDKRIGVAVTGPLGMTVQPVATIKRKSVREDTRAIEQYIGEYNVDTLVVGLPLRANGEIGIQAKKVQDFADRLATGLWQNHPDLKVDMWDESMTTAEAQEFLSEAGVKSKKRKQVVDQLAAVFILKSYLLGKGVRKKYGDL